jgi:chorismate mutase
LDTYIDQQDWQGLEQKLTRKNVEDRIIRRVKQKVAYAQKRINKKVRNTIEPELILKFYKDTIIPLTKQGEVLYLGHRIR